MDIMHQVLWHNKLVRHELLVIMIFKLRPDIFLLIIITFSNSIQNGLGKVKSTTSSYLN